MDATTDAREAALESEIVRAEASLGDTILEACNDAGFAPEHAGRITIAAGTRLIAALYGPEQTARILEALARHIRKRGGIEGHA